MNSRSPMSSTTLSTAVTSPKRLDTLESRTPATAGQRRSPTACPAPSPGGHGRWAVVPYAPGRCPSMPPPPPGRRSPPASRDLDRIAEDLADVEVALERLDAGTYWTCEVTGEPLPDELLAADPDRPAPTAGSTAARGRGDPPAALVAAGGPRARLAAISLSSIPIAGPASPAQGAVWRLSARRGADWTVHRVRRAGASEERRAELDARFVIRTRRGHRPRARADEGRADEGRASCSASSSRVCPRRPSGRWPRCRPTRRRWRRAWPRRSSARSWATTPSACSATGSPNRWRRPASARCTGRCCRDGRPVAVKVQYPGVDTAIQADLDNAEVLYGLFSAFALKGLDVHALVDELRMRMGDELDYRIEAANQTEFAAALPRPPLHRRARRGPERLDAAGAHDGVGRRSGVGRVPRHRRPRRHGSGPGEILFRFAQGSVHRLGRVQRRPASGQLPLPARRPGRVPRLRAGQAVDAGRVGAAVAVPRRHPRPPTPTGCSSAMEDVELPRRPVTASTPEAVFDYVSTPVPAVPHRAVHLHPRVRGATPSSGSPTCSGPHAEVIGQAQPAGQLRHPRPGGLGRVRAAGQAGGRGSVAGDPGRVPRRRAAVHAARRAGRRPGGLDRTVERDASDGVQRHGQREPGGFRIDG